MRVVSLGLVLVVRMSWLKLWFIHHVLVFEALG